MSYLCPGAACVVERGHGSPPREHYARELCKRCYGHERRKGPLPPLNRPTLEEQFTSRIHTDESGCWIWTGPFNNHGYGRLSKQYAHRISVELHHGPIPNGMDVLHSCDNPPCVNPDHLRVGTHAENMADAAAKGRIKRVGPKGEASHRAKLTWEAARAIRRAHAAGTSQRELGRRYGVHPRNIKFIVDGRTWREEHDPARAVELLTRRGLSITGGTA